MQLWEGKNLRNHLLDSESSLLLAYSFIFSDTENIVHSIPSLMLRNISEIICHYPQSNFTIHSSHGLYCAELKPLLLHKYFLIMLVELSG